MASRDEALVRVLHVITRLIVGGAQENTLWTAALLDPSRFAVEVLCGPEAGSEGSLLREARERGIAVSLVPSLRRRLSPVWDPVALLSLVRTMRSGRYQIVHTHSSKAGILGRLAARAAGVPVIVHTVHGWSFHEHLSPLVRRLYVSLERRTARFTDALIAVSSRDIEKGLRERIGESGLYHRIRSAIPLADFDPTGVDRSEVRRELGLPLEAPVLGYLGRLSEQKNPREWVEVATRVAHAIPESRFLIVGDGPDRALLDRWAAGPEITGRARLTGLRRDVARMLAAMDVVLLTSRWEGLPRVIPQTLAMKVPVVACRVDGIVEAIHDGETGLLGEPGDVAGLAARCVQLLRDPGRRAELGRAGREWVLGEFDVESMVHGIGGLYERLLAAKGLG